ncbi:MAG: 2-amino-4-hydroxy-6-hydroxymethyldihydropteridine diphosphokinase [Sulfolobaceae archaeon]|nr:2-amino-4-hydroxy-6-hydroxymethyldihydropteridine diphosphokinase [Sulfolobaceae archaeon]
MLLDKIIIEGITVQTIIGVNPQERVKKQEVKIDLTLWADLSEGEESDNILKTVDYKAIKKEIISYVQYSNFYLLETLTARIAKICFQDSRVRKVKVRVYKPGALSSAENVAIEVSRKNPRGKDVSLVYISLGSNISPEENIYNALKLLSSYLKINAMSNAYLTDPIPEGSNQPPYYNLSIEAETTLDPYRLKNLLRYIEDVLGRKRTEDKYAPRTIDLDIEVYGNLVIDELKIPDPDIVERPFLALTLYEVNEDLVIPKINKSIKEIVSNAKIGKIKLLEDYTNKLCNEFKGVRCAKDTLFHSKNP